MNQEQWRKKSYDEWVGRTTGSRLNIDQARGADARRAADAAARARWQDIPKPPTFSPPVPSGRPAPPAASHPPVIGPVGGSWSTPRVRSSGSVKVSRTLALLGALVGYVYGVSTTAQTPWFYAVAGGVIGVFALDVLAFVFKLVRIVVLAILTLVGVAIALYVLAKLIGT